MQLERIQFSSPHSASSPSNFASSARSSRAAAHSTQIGGVFSCSRVYVSFRPALYRCAPMRCPLLSCVRSRGRLHCSVCALAVSCSSACFPLDMLPLCYGCASTPRLTRSSLSSGLSDPFPSRSIPPVPSSIPAQVPSPFLRYSQTCLASPLRLVARDPALTFGPALAPLSPTRVCSAFCLVFVCISKASRLLTRCLLSPFTPSA